MGIKWIRLNIREMREALSQETVIRGTGYKVLRNIFNAHKGKK